MTEERKFLPAVTTSLALASGIGLMETVALIFGSGTLMDVIGIPVVCRTTLSTVTRLKHLLYLRFGAQFVMCLAGNVQINAFFVFLTK